MPTTRLIDLTHPVAPGMPAYPGTDPPTFTPVAAVADDGYAERTVTMVSHTGTHLDAPAHMIPGGATLDALPVDTFAGPACVIDVRECAGGTVGVDRLEPHADVIARCDFVLLRTGWDARWGTPAFFDDFPLLTADAARRLAAAGLKGVGADVISYDPVGADEFPIHHVLLGAGLILVENLTGLDALPDGPFEFACYPLKLADADGAPCRAVARVV